VCFHTMLIQQFVRREFRRGFINSERDRVETQNRLEPGFHSPQQSSS
jgi:hypothetical protein